MAKSIINCKFCGNLLAEPTGGKANIFGKTHAIIDHSLSKIIIKTDQTNVKKSTKLLLDTMIIHQLLDGKSIHELAGINPNDNVELVILDRILIETKHMESDKFNRRLDANEISDKLEKIANVTHVTIDYASEEMLRAKELYESKKYVNGKGTPLSETDSILLQKALTIEGVRLITQDKTLIFAFEKEKQFYCD